MPTRPDGSWDMGGYSDMYEPYQSNQNNNRKNVGGNSNSGCMVLLIFVAMAFLMFSCNKWPIPL